MTCNSEISPKLYPVQIAKDFYDILNNSAVKRKYPNLHNEIKQQTQMCHSSWYNLSYEAFSEYAGYLEDYSIPYIM